jgi:hypothetical protein
MADTTDRHWIRLRAPCAECGFEAGYTLERNGQDVAYCECGTYQGYNASRSETGRAVRTLASRPTIKPSKRSRVLDDFGHRCVSCGAAPPDVRLDLAHLISREDAERLGFLDDVIDSEWNLAPMCAECNSGQRVHGTHSLILIYRCLQIRERRQTGGEAA